jgi:hypothetical protein
MRARLAVIATISLGAAAWSPSASAEIGVVHPDLVRAEAAARAAIAHPPEIYAALRDVWRTWDRADPAQVEEVINGVAQASGASPQARVYATLLAATWTAPPRASRSSASSIGG